MERNPTWALPPALPSRHGYQGTSHPLQLNPPKSREVLSALASYLTPPIRTTRSAGADGAGRSRAGAFPHVSTLWAYHACAQIIRQHSKSFYLSARLLPATKRHGIMALYAFCRTSDDLVDEADTLAGHEAARQDAALRLEQWADALAAESHPGSDHPVVHAWSHTRAHFSIPDALPQELLSGVRMDLTISRYETWDDLWVYCYRVASTVGLMSMYITGADGLEAVPYAVQLGIALQLTNILRDIGEDARAGRVYIPAEDLARFGHSEDELRQGLVSPAFIRLMDFEIARARALYDAAWPGIALLPRDSRLAVAAAATFYRRILDKIVANGYDVFTRRAHLTTGEKVRVMPGLWWRARSAASTAVQTL